MTLPRVLISGVLACIALIPMAPAQDQLPKQRVSFLAFDAPDTLTAIYVLIEKDSYVKLGLLGSNITKPLLVANPDGHITIYDKPVTSADGKTVYPVLGRITSSMAAKEVMVVLMAEKKDGKDLLTGFAFPNSKKDLPLGSIKLANLSPYPVRGMLGKSKLLFKPGMIETIKLDEKLGSMINVVFQYQEKDSWHRMMAAMWVVTDTERTLVFAFKSPLTGFMKSRCIPLRSD